MAASSGPPSLPLVDDLVVLSRLSLVLESHEVFKLARHTMAMNDEYLIMAAVRVLRRAAQYPSPFQVPLAKVVAHAVGESTTCEFTSLAFCVFAHPL